MFLVIEDDQEWIDMLQGQVPALVATDAKAGLDILHSRNVTKVLCDFHGIQKDGLNAHDVVKFCLERGIECVLTTNDPLTQIEFEEKYGVSTITKMEMAITAKRAC